MVKAITVNIGSNDEIAAIKQCEDEVKKEFEKEGKSKYGGSPQAAVLKCIEFTAPNVTIPHILKNIGSILGVLDTVLQRADRPARLLQPGHVRAPGE